jgi:sec-independent protein translocase protein TatB
MFDFAWSELALIAVVALVVIGPKDLPRVMRTVGQWVRKARSIAREFQSGLDEMMRESELDEVKKNLDKATAFNLDQEITKAVDPTGELERSIAAPELKNPLAEMPPAAPAPEKPAAEPPTKKSAP